MFQLCSQDFSLDCNSKHQRLPLYNIVRAKNIYPQHFARGKQVTSIKTQKRRSRIRRSHADPSLDSK